MVTWHSRWLSQADIVLSGAILKKSSVSVEIEVRPRQLVPDTNCFIDYLPQLQSITKATAGAQPIYTLMVPLVDSPILYFFTIILNLFLKDWTNKIFNVLTIKTETHKRPYKVSSVAIAASWKEDYRKFSLLDSRPAFKFQPNGGALGFSTLSTQRSTNAVFNECRLSEVVVKKVVILKLKESFEKTGGFLITCSLLSVVLPERYSLSENHEVPMKVRGRLKSISSSITVVRLQLEINVNMRYAYSFLSKEKYECIYDLSKFALPKSCQDVSTNMEAEKSLLILNELEGLARGADARDCPPASRATLDPEHVARVAESAKVALAFARSRNPAIRCLTTRGTVLTSSTFTVEEDVDKDKLTRNDDRILATCLSLCRTGNKDYNNSAEEGQPRRLRREVVLLTEDRNLRVKALARDVPVREVPDFMEWAGLG
ncbi:telomerase-binding protein EST1A-like isoform X4 [Vespula maculifrons]|uniref:Telomerase-binding protein EST1A-like isoform X4 n=1 Tax=Vespula maculifrons TaxID=7453 RepID=A0ABD2C7T6_VESMC